MKKYITILLLMLAALPVAAQNMISFGVNAMDSIMVGTLGDQVSLECSVPMSAVISSFTILKTCWEGLMLSSTS